MSNKRFSNVAPGHGADRGASAPRKPAGAPTVKEKTPSWGALPGKASANRSAGVKKVPVYPKTTL